MKRSTKGIPDNLKTLAKAGKRIRFNGFWLGESERDRALAEWIDNTPQAGAVMKALLYAAISGQGFGVGQRDHVAAIDEYPEEIDIGAAGSALLELDD